MEKLTKVELSNLDKVLYPELRITKAKIIEYYIKMAPRILEMLAKRPIVLTRYPDGVGKEGFYEKDAPQGTPSWVETFKTYSKGAKHYVNFIVCKDLDTLIWLANLAALEMHIPLSKTDSIENPDLVLFDMDPEPPADTDSVIKVALQLKEKLGSLGLKSYVKTTGKKGLHVVVPVTRRYTFKQTRDFVHEVGKELSKTSGLVVSESSKSKIPGKVFVDYAQNSNGRTMICPYSLRVTPHATVSTPLDWKHIEKGLKPAEFNIFSVPRITDNPWKDIFEQKQKLEVK